MDKHLLDGNKASYGSTSDTAHTSGINEDNQTNQTSNESPDSQSVQDNQTGCNNCKNINGSADISLVLCISNAMHFLLKMEHILDYTVVLYKM